MKRTTFSVEHPDGPLRFTFWRDSRPPPAWLLQDHEGYIRTLAPTWIDSIPMIRRIVENYGGSCNIS